jgi:hypothetical protein
VLYENLVIRRPQNLSLLAHALTSDARSPGKWIRAVEFALNDLPTGQYLGSCLAHSYTVLLHAPRLQAYRAVHPFATFGGHLASMFSVAQSTLTALHIFVNTSARSTLPMLAHFTALRNLCIELDSENAPFIANLSALSLPSVESLAFMCEDEPLGPVGHWILTSSFQNVKRIHLYLPFMQLSESSVTAHFLDAHNGTCEKLVFDGQLNIGGSQSATHFDRSLSTTSKHLAFLAYVPTSRLFTYWSPRSKMTVLSVCSTIDGTQLFELMDDMLKRDFSIHGLRMHISLRGSHFTWDCGSRSAEHGKFVGQLVHYNFAFMSQGVDIVDEDGFAVSRRRVE